MKQKLVESVKYNAVKDWNPMPPKDTLYKTSPTFKWIIKNIKSKYVVEIDSDLSHHPKDISKGIDVLKNTNCDLVIGSKYIKNSIVKNREPIRVFISKFMTVVCKYLFDSRVSDYTNTFRFYNYSLIKEFVKQKLVFKSPIGHLNNLLFIINHKMYYIIFICFTITPIYTNFFFF